MGSKTNKVLKQLSSPVETRTPIGTDTFLPNHSGRHHNLTVDQMIAPVDILNTDGVLVARIDENGNLFIKGRQLKL